jgi:hypothetical protein
MSDSLPHRESTIRPRYLTWIIGGILLVYFPVALWLKRSYVPLPRPPGTVAQVVNAVKFPDNGFAYFSAAPAPGLVAIADTPDAPRRSSIVLYEDLTPLGPAHSSIADIRLIGHGRFSHTEKGFIFTASDDSDPAKNGHHYWAVLPTD